MQEPIPMILMHRIDFYLHYVIVEDDNEAQVEDVTDIDINW